MNRKNASPPRQNGKVSLKRCRFTLVGCRWYRTLFIVPRARSRWVSLYPLRNTDPGRNTDFQMSPSRILSKASIGRGGFGSLLSLPRRPGGRSSVFATLLPVLPLALFDLFGLL